MPELETRYTFLHFEADQKPNVWNCLTRSREVLGQVSYYAPWRQWCYFPLAPAVYSVGCLQDIQNFVVQVNALMEEQAHDAQ